jgi:ribosomal protein S18 acetylase RimI-like enzyme
MDDVTIREATPEDVAAVQRVGRESWHAAHDDILGSDTVERVIDEWYDAKSIAESISRDDGPFFVASEGNDVVGFAHAVLRDDEPAWLSRIYVAPDRWGDGLGTALLERVEGLLREADADRLRLAVMADNGVANAFYETHGYAMVEERDEELFAVTFEEYVREKEL